MATFTNQINNGLIDPTKPREDGNGFNFLYFYGFGINPFKNNLLHTRKDATK